MTHKSWVILRCHSLSSSRGLGLRTKQSPKGHHVHIRPHLIVNNVPIYRWKQNKKDLRAYKSGKIVVDLQPIGIAIATETDMPKESAGGCGLVRQASEMPPPAQNKHAWAVRHHAAMAVAAQKEAAMMVAELKESRTSEKVRPPSGSGYTPPPPALLCEQEGEAPPFFSIDLGAACNTRDKGQSGGGRRGPNRRAHALKICAAVK